MAANTISGFNQYINFQRPETSNSGATVIQQQNAAAASGILNQDDTTMPRDAFQVTLTQTTQTLKADRMSEPPPEPPPEPVPAQPPAPATKDMQQPRALNGTGTGEFINLIA